MYGALSGQWLMLLSASFASKSRRKTTLARFSFSANGNTYCQVTQYRPVQATVFVRMGGVRMGWGYSVGCNHCLLLLNSTHWTFNHCGLPNILTIKP